METFGVYYLDVKRPLKHVICLFILTVYLPLSSSLKKKKKTRLATCSLWEFPIVHMKSV